MGSTENKKDLMKNKTAVLEYRITEQGGVRGKWGFRFKSPEGAVLMESVELYDSLEQAERGFVRLIKTVATNQYTIEHNSEVRVVSPRMIPNHRQRPAL